MRKQQINERKQATPTGIPIICLITFCVILIPVESSMKPLGLAVIDLDFLLNVRSALVFTAVPFIVLVIAELSYKPIWRSALFSGGSVILIIEWVLVIGQLKPILLVTFLSSLPFLILVLLWNARSMNFILRLDKRWRSLP